MASAMEALGLSLPGTASPPATDQRRYEASYLSGLAVMRLLENGIRPSDILTFEAFENAIAVVQAMGGSTNAFLHIPAIAKEAGVKVTLDDFERVGRRTPKIADLRPGGRYVMYDLDRGWWSSSHHEETAREGTLDMETRSRLPVRRFGRIIEEMHFDGNPQDIVRDVSDPFSREGGLAVLRGNLAPDGAVAKISGATRLLHRGPARVFDSEEEAFAMVNRREVEPSDVVVIRYEGPKGGPGMREMLAITAAIVGQDLGEKVALSDRRTILRRNTWVDGGPCFARGSGRRAARSSEEWRHCNS